MGCLETVRDRPAGPAPADTVTGGRLADRYGRVPVTGFALFHAFSLTVTLGQDYLPGRIGTSSGVTLGLAISTGGLLAPAFGAIADAVGLHLALVMR
jgi:MFS family permease